MVAMRCLRKGCKRIGRSLLFLCRAKRVSMFAFERLVFAVWYVIFVR